MTARLAIWDDDWAFRPEDCPCDVDLVAWLDEAEIADATIFHFGTGGHHHVGVACAEAGRGRVTLGITAAPREHESFVRLAIARPEVLRAYNVLFGDIYLLHRRLLPVLDVATLFHLCEFRGEANDAYGAMTDLELTHLIADRVRPGGHILFFPGSFAWSGREGANAADVVAEWAAARDVEEVGRFRSLLVYRKRS